MVKKDRASPYAEAAFSYPEIHEGLPLLGEPGHVGTLFLNDPVYLEALNGCILDTENGTLRKPDPDIPESDTDSDVAAARPETGEAKQSQEAMSTQDRYIDARLAGIENKLDARMEAMQRFQERAEDRFERAAQRHDAELALQRQRSDEAYRDLYNLVDSSRKHASNMAAVTIFGTVGGVLAALALVITLGAGWLSDQSAWLRDSVNRIEQRVEAQSGPATPAQVEPEAQPEPPAATSE